MIHPSYYELMEKMNEVNRQEGLPEIASRYYIVLAASKRARQLIDGAEPKVPISSPKLLSVAIDELYKGLVKGVKEEEAVSEETGFEEEAAVQQSDETDVQEMAEEPAEI